MNIATEQHSSTTTVRSFYAAIERGDIEEVTRLCTPDVTVSVPGSSPLAGLYSGRDAAIGFLGKMQAAAGGTENRQSVGARYGGLDALSHPFPDQHPSVA